MTRKVFWEDPYLTRLETRVAAVADDEVALEATIFYALSGGQESDRGTIGGRPVLEARKQGRELLYRLEPGHGLVAGEGVVVEIDGVRRHRLMRLHFAAEVVLELAYRRLLAGDQPVEKVGAHIGEDKARIDFALDSPVTPALPALAAEANAILAAGHDIVCAYADEAAERRYWQIEGFARVPCGGTHVRNTREIGPIALKRRNIGRGKERIEIYLA